MEEVKRRGRPKKINTSEVIPDNQDSVNHKKEERRGRPKAGPEVEDMPTKFNREYEDKSTGIKSIWKYDAKKSKNGPYEVENIYPKNYDDTLPDDDSLPLTKRQWINPKNNKLVGYGRAVQLGIYVPDKEKATKEVVKKSGSGKRGRPKKSEEMPKQVVCAKKGCKSTDIKNQGSYKICMECGYHQ